MNIVILAGRVGKDPLSTMTTTGKIVVRFSLATSEYGDKTEWHNIEAWNKTAEIIEKYVLKGDKLTVSGRIKTNEYTDKEGVDRKSTVVVADRVELGGKRQPKVQNSESGFAPSQGFSKEDNLPF